MMADYVQYKLTGADALSAKFRELSQGVRTQVAVPAAKDAMEIVLKDAQDRASRVDDPETRNYLPKNIAMVEQKTEGADLGAAIVSVGVRKTKTGQRGGNTFYWWWVELGTERSRAQPMLRPALANNREAVFKEFLSSAKFQLLKLGAN
jgi:HK97 gp10 family phage protein